MRFLVAPDIFARFPGMRLAVVVAEGLENQNTPVDLAARWQATWREAAQAAVYGNAQSHPRIRPWREHFQASGISGKAFPSSIEALLRRALKGGEPFSIIVHLSPLQFKPFFISSGGKCSQSRPALQPCRVDLGLRFVRQGSQPAGG